uniref:Uncharacterized protein n=1 Tax=Setaria digitata TaxID=48799 RepID=A0A915Q7M0_9BILA
MLKNEEMQSAEKSKRIEDAIHRLHVLYMKYFSLDDPWQPKTDRTIERAELLHAMAVSVDEILNAEERPNWLHPAMFHGPLTTAICSLPPVPDQNAILMPPTTDPREVYWSKFSICNHLRPLEDKPLVLSLHYHPPRPLQSSENSLKSSSENHAEFSSLKPSSSTTTGNASESLTDATSNHPPTASFKKTTLPRVGALPNDKFRDAQQIKIEHYVGQILRAYGLRFNRTNDENEPQAYLYQLPSTSHPNFG